MPGQFIFILPWCVCIEATETFFIIVAFLALDQVFAFVVAILYLPYSVFICSQEKQLNKYGNIIMSSNQQQTVKVEKNFSVQSMPLLDSTDDNKLLNIMKKIILKDSLRQGETLIYSS